MIRLVQFRWLSLVLAEAVHLSSQSHTLSETADGANLVCEARTINYITQTLPQACLPSGWTNADIQPNTLATNAIPDTTGNTLFSSIVASPAPTAYNSQSGAPSSDTIEENPFMSFEDWKEIMMRKIGQDSNTMRSRAITGMQADDSSLNESDSAGIGEKEETSMEIDSSQELHASRNHPPRGHDSMYDKEGDQAVAYDDGQMIVHQSKDAGKTCKERFSYSSFDAGATVLKTGPATKNAKAILVENKDTYMLLECAKKGFVIVELSDDVLIDTIVLANFEFFSSMIRHFRVSVSDRYPVKLERWKVIGVFEARNNRDVQAFLVEDPQIFAKYIRIEFLTHYSNEYYCPVSLLRVHGTRMLDSWKDSEISRDDEETGDGLPEIEATSEGVAPDAFRSAVVEATHASKPSAAERSFTLCGAAISGISIEIFRPMSCAASPTTSWMGGLNTLQTSSSGRIVQPSHTAPSRLDTPAPLHLFISETSEEASQIAAALAPQATPISADGKASVVSSDRPVRNLTATYSLATADPSTETIAGTTTPCDNTKVSDSETTTVKARASPTGSAASTSPTIQQGFFNSMTKRLQQVEANFTLSLKYIEDQSRHMQDVFQRTEQRQSARVAQYLETVNRTVLSELRDIRREYDQIWQSTVIALDSQREHSEHDIVALSTRLNLLADEVVFQKRMAVVQALLLLACLFLVIFSRGVPLPYFAPLLEQDTSDGANTIIQAGKQQRSTHVERRGRMVQLRDAEQPTSTLRQDKSSLITDTAGSVRSPAARPAKQDNLVEALGDLDHCEGRSPSLLLAQATQQFNQSDSLSAYSQSEIGSHRRHHTPRKPLPALPEHSATLVD